MRSLKLKEIYAIRIRLQLEKRVRELALFNLAIDSKLRGCDLVKLRVSDVMQSNRMMSRTMVMQQKTHRPVQFELTEQTRDTVGAWINQAQLKSDQCIFPSRVHASEHISTRQYERLLKGWVVSIGLDPAAYGTHTMRSYAESRTMPSRTFGIGDRAAMHGFCVNRLHSA
jgi:integrase